MSSAAQVLRQAESLKATISESGKGVSDLWVTRQRLEDLYKRLLLMDLEYALDKKVEQDLWNHAFKNQITVLQTQVKEKNNPKKAELQANLNLFLETASGFYLQFLQLICSTFRLDLPFRRKSAAFGVMKEKCHLRSKITPPKKSSCLYICQYCLVHLGDIARYRQQVEQAQTYYRHAVNLSPQNGQPYNQLAILEVNRNNKLSSVFYYVRSLAVRHPFPVAATNLEKFYSKLIKDTSEFKGKMAQNEFVNAFLQFQALLHLAADFDRASYLCSRILACLPTHLMSQTFSASVLVQCIAITIFTLNHVRHIPSGGDGCGSVTSKVDESGVGGHVEGTKNTDSSSQPKAEVLLSSDEQKSVDIILGFTTSVLELLVQHTPRLPVKARESPTLPAIQVLLDWLRHSPDIIVSPPFSTSNLWGHMAKVLNIIQQFSTDKPKPDLTKYEEVPLPEDTELRCFQPIEKAHSKYCFSRIPVDGFPRGVEELVRCMRLVNQGKSIAEEFPELKLAATQQIDPPCINFSAPEPRKGVEAACPQDRRSKQNVAMQAIMKHGQNEPTELGKVGDKEASTLSGQSPPKYLLGTVTSEPQFMKHGGSGAYNVGSGGNSTHLQASPQPSPSSLVRRGQSPQGRGSSPMSGFSSSRGASPMPGQARVASPLLPAQAQPQPQPQPQPQNQQVQQQPLQLSPPLVQPNQQPQMMKQNLVQKQQQSQFPPQQPQQQQQQQQQHFAINSQAHMRCPPPMGARLPVSASPTPALTERGPAPTHMFQSGLYQGQSHTGQGGGIQGHSGLSQTHMPQGQSHLHPQIHPYQGQGQGVPMVQGHRGDVQPPSQSAQAQENSNSFPPFQMPFQGVGNDRFRMPVHGLGPRAPTDASRMPHFQQPQPASAAASVSQGPISPQGVRPVGASHGLNQEMLSALRLASQISHHQQQQQLGMGPHLSPPQSQQQQQQPLHQLQQQQQQQPQPHQRQQQLHLQDQQQQQLQHGMSRGAMQRAPVMGHGPTLGPSPVGVPSISSQFPSSGMQHPFHPGAGLGLPPGPGDLMQSLGPSTHSQTHPHPHLQGPLSVGAQRAHEMGSSQGPPPPIPMPGHQSLSSTAGFQSLAHQLFKEEVKSQRAETGRGYQALSPLTIQPPKPSPPDNRISTSFQGHAEGTPKPEKTDSFSLDKREGEPVIRRVEMPVAQPSGEYSLFASSSPWSMPLNSSSESKSLTSSPFSSQEGSMRNSPIVGFDQPASSAYESSMRYRGQQTDSWVGQSPGHEEGKARSQSQSMWSDAPSMTPLERLLEQQRLQRQTDPH